MEADLETRKRKKYKSQKKMFIYGITLDNNYKEKIDYYTVM